MISCSFSSLTRKVALGSNSVTTPGNSSTSSLAILSPEMVPRAIMASRDRKIGRNLLQFIGFVNHLPQSAFPPAGKPGKWLVYHAFGPQECRPNGAKVMTPGIRDGRG